MAVVKIWGISPDAAKPALIEQVAKAVADDKNLRIEPDDVWVHIVSELLPSNIRHRVRVEVSRIQYHDLEPERQDKLAKRLYEVLRAYVRKHIDRHFIGGEKQITCKRIRVDIDRFDSRSYGIYNYDLTVDGDKIKMMICKNCGHELTATQVNCRNCGNKNNFCGTY